MSKRGRFWLEAGLVLGAFIVLALVAFRPLFFRWGALPTYAQGSTPAMALADRNLNVWIIAWVAHALVTDPARLFDGNILFPAPDTLAGSEHMLAHVPFTVPMYLLSGSSAYVLKAMMLESVVLTAFAAYLLIRHHTGDGAAGLAAGALLTLSPWRYEPRGMIGGVAAEPQYLGFQFLPLALLGLALFVERGRVAAWLGFAVAMALQALASFYLGYLSFATVPVYAAVLLAARPQGAGWRRPREIDWGRGVALVAALGVAALLVLPTALPYLRLRRTGVVPSYGLEVVATLSAAPWTFFTPSGLALLGPLAAVPGTAFALWRLGGWATGRGRPLGAGERAAWALLGAGFVLGWGPYQEIPGGWRLPLPFYLLWKLVPGFSAMRGAGRFVVILSLGFSLATGYALAAARGWLGRARWPVAVGVLLAAVAWASWEPVRAEPGGVGADAPPAYRWLAQRPPREPVLELPAKAGEDDLWGLLTDSKYMLGSTVHWQPLLNGYTAYEPPSRYVLSALANRLPARGALDRLVALVDLRWIVVHRKLLDPVQRAAFDRETPGLVEVARWDDDVLYEVVTPRSFDWRRRLLEPPGPTSLEGNPRAPLPAECRRAALEIDAPRELHHRYRKARLETRITNLGSCRWPGLGVGNDGLVMLEYEWLAGDQVVVTGSPGRLTRDVAPGATVDEPLFVLTPLGPGVHRLRVTLRQQGEAEPLAVAERDVEVIPARR